MITGFPVFDWEEECLLKYDGNKKLHDTSLPCLDT